MKKNMYKCAYATAFVIMAAILILSGTAFASDPGTEVFTDDVIEEPASHESNPGVMHDNDEVGQPEVPVWVSVFDQWEREGYPDDIGGVYYDSSANSNGILVVNPSPQRMAELRELFGADIIITPCTFSYYELMMVNNEIIEMMRSNPNSGIYGVGIGWTSSGGRVQGFGESGKEFRVAVSVDESVFDHYSTGFMNRYGERVNVEIGYEATTDDMEGGTTMTDNSIIVPIEITGVFSGGIGTGGNIIFNNSYWLWFMISIALLGALLLFVGLRLRRTPAMQTANGGIVTVNNVLTRKQVIAAVKNSDAMPSDELYETIIQRINSHR